MNELERSITEARKHCNPRAIVVINPGNPTGMFLFNTQSIICNLSGIKLKLWYLRSFFSYFLVFHYNNYY